MTAKDFLNYKKPHFWIALVTVIVLIFAGVVAVLDKEEPAEQVTVPPAAEVEVEIEEVPEEPAKTDSEIILERFSSMDWEEVKKNAKEFGEEGWEEGIVLLAEIPGIKLYGYNDADYKLRGTAIDYKGHVSYFDWVYTSNKTYIQPEMYWNGDANQLQITLNLYEGEGINAEELHVLLVHDTMTMEDFVLRSSDYLMEIEDRMAGTGTVVGEYVDIKLGQTMKLEFEPVKTVDGEQRTLKLHQAIIYLKPSKDGYVFEIGDIGVEPEKRSATIEIEGEEESFTEVEYISKEGFTLWYPEYILEPYKIYSHEGFVLPNMGDQSSVKVTLVPEDDMELDESYLEEAAGNFKSSGEYKKVKISKIKTLKADDKNVKIKMIEVVHDDTADRFYFIEGKKNALLVTVSMTTESLEGMGARVNKMLQTISFK